MKYTLSAKSLADFKAQQCTDLPFDSITFEYSDSQGLLQDAQATKQVDVDLLNVDNSLLVALSDLAQLEMKRADIKHVHLPEGLNEQQAFAVVRKWKQNPDGSPSIQHFFNRVQVYRDYAGLNWCGMFLGIEPDGYTHS